MAEADNTDVNGQPRKPKPRRRRSAGGLRGLDLVQPTPPSNHSTSVGVEQQQASKPVTNVGNEQASKPASEPPAEPDDHRADVPPPEVDLNPEPKPPAEKPVEQATVEPADVEPEPPAEKPAQQPAPQQPQQPPNADPDPAAQPAASEMAWGVDSLVGGIDPEEDRHQSGLRLPRYVFEALRLQATITRQKQQVIAAEAVKAYLPPELLDGTYRRLYGRQRPHL